MCWECSKYLKEFISIVQGYFWWKITQRILERIVIETRKYRGIFRKTSCKTNCRQWDKVTCKGSEVCALHLLYSSSIRATEEAAILPAMEAVHSKRSQDPTPPASLLESPPVPLLFPGVSLIQGQVIPFSFLPTSALGRPAWAGVGASGPWGLCQPHAFLWKQILGSLVNSKKFQPERVMLEALFRWKECHSQCDSLVCSQEKCLATCFPYVKQGQEWLLSFFYCTCHATNC